MDTTKSGLTAYNPIANGKPIRVFNDTNRADCLVEYDTSRVETVYPDAIEHGRKQLEGK